MVKKALSLILALVMILGSIGVAFAEGEATPAAPETTEVAAPATENAKVKWLQENGYVKGYADGSLGLDKTITRAEFAAILVRGMGMEEEATKAMAVPSKFVDMGGHWANGYVEVAVGNGLVKGYPNNTFRPNAQITYAEVVAMLVRASKSITPVEELTAIWPNTYIVKAAQANILENTLIGDYNQAAVREKAFELVYNAVNNADLKAFGNNSVVKAIVVQNNRVRKDLKKNEVNVEFMKVLQESDYVANMRKSGTIEGKQKAFVLDEKVADVEDIFGKVVDLTLDKNGNVIKVTEDEKYVQKLVEVDYRSSQLSEYKFNGFTVNFNERYAKNDERIFVTYNDNLDYTYAGFIKDIKDKKIAPTYAKITLSDTKNVLFIDAYEFEDVAPVESVKGDIYFYNDMRDGRVDRIAPKAFIIGYTDKYGFRRIDAKDIVKDDVIHVYSRGIIVRQDAKIEAELKRTYVDRDNDEYLVVGDSELYLNPKDRFAPIYSYEKKEYRTFTERRAMDPLLRKNVKALRCIGDTVQLIDGDIKFVGGIAGIDNIRSAGEVRFLPSQGEKYVGVETFDTDYFDAAGNTLNRQLVDNFDRADIVYANVKEKEKVGNEILEMFNLKPEKVYKDEFKSAKITARYLTVADDSYMYTNRTNTFIYNPKTRSLKQFTMDAAYKNNKNNDKLKAVVLTEADVYKALSGQKIKVYNFIKNDPRVANTVIFVDAKGSKGDVDARYAQLDRIYDTTNEIRVIYSNEDQFKNAKDEVVESQILRLDTKNITLKNGKVVKLSNENIGDILAIEIDEASLKEKDDKAPLVVSMLQVIEAEQATEEIIGGQGTKLIFKGNIERYTTYTKSFGKSYNKHAQIYQRTEDQPYYLTVIRYFASPKGGQVVKDVITWVNEEFQHNGNRTFAVNGKVYEFTANAILEKDGTEYQGDVAIMKRLKVGDIVGEMKKNKDGFVTFLKVKTPAVPQPELSEEAKAFIAKVSSVEPKVTSALTMNTLDALKAVRTELEAVRADYNKLPAAQQAFKEVKDAEAALKAMEDKVAEAIKKLEPTPAISATITKKTALGVSQCTIVLTGAVAKDVDPASFKGEKKDGSSWKPEVDAAALAANATDTFVVMTADALEAGDKLIFKVGAQVVVAELK